MRGTGSVRSDRAVERYFAGDLLAIDHIAVRQHSGPFIEHAWDVLRAVPAGSPITYAELAAKVGRPARGPRRGQRVRLQRRRPLRSVPPHRPDGRRPVRASSGWLPLGAAGEAPAARPRGRNRNSHESLTRFSANSQNSPPCWGREPHGASQRLASSSPTTRRTSASCWTPPCGTSGSTWPRRRTGGRRSSRRRRPARPDRARRDAPRPRRLRGVPAPPGRRRSDVPVMFLTARDATEDKVRGLTLGGDDYVTKPFSLEELVARVHARSLRRRRRRGRRLGAASSPTSRWTRTPTVVWRPASASTCRPPSTSCSASSCSTRAACVSGPDPRSRVGVRLRRRGQRGRDLRELPPQEARPAGRPVDPDGARRRLRRFDRTDMSLRHRLVAALVLIGVTLVVAGVVVAGRFGARSSTKSTASSSAPHPRSVSSSARSNRARRSVCARARTPTIASPSCTSRSRRPRAAGVRADGGFRAAT